MKKLILRARRRRRGEVTVDWAEAENPDPIPAPKLVNVVNAHADIVNVLDGRLPGLPVAMRLGWSQRAEFIAADFARRRRR